METRLQKLEKIVKHSHHTDERPSISLIQDAITQNREESKASSLQAIQDRFVGAANLIGVKLKNFTSVCGFAVSFIEDNATDIARLVGSTLYGQIKFDIACKLVGSLFSNIAFELIGQTIESQHSLMVSRKAHTIERVSVVDKIIDISPPPRIIDLPVKKKTKSRWSRKTR